MATNEKWYKKVWVWLVGIGAGIIAFFRIRDRISGQSGSGVERIGDDLERVDNAVTGTTNAVSEVAGTVADLDDTVQRVTDTSEQLADTSERIAELSDKATNSVGRIRELINAERERTKDLENHQ
jgi:methyl-accepting chemotaxis protein